MIKIGDTVIVMVSDYRNRIPVGTKGLVTSVWATGVNLTYKKGTQVNTTYINKKKIQKEFRNETKLGKLL